MRKLVFLSLCLIAPLVHAEDCSWMPVSKINAAFPDRAPWSLMIGGQGRCKFVSDQSKPSSVISLTQMIQSSPAEAESYAKTVGGGMAESYAVKPDPGIGKAGYAVRQKEADGNMLTLIGHQKNVVVMTQMMFQGGVSAAQQMVAEELTKQTFTADTGGGLKLPGK
jgi:hypothetical protein